MLRINHGVDEGKHASPRVQLLLPPLIVPLPEIDAETISRVWCATVKNAGTHDERLEFEVALPDIHK
jgi:hypothetical protein